MEILKKSNILIHETKGVQLIDFGLSSTMFTNNSVYINGTIWYRAPEIALDPCNGGTESDIWSLACIMYEKITGEILFPAKNNNELIEFITKFKDRKLKELSTDIHFMDLLSRMLEITPAKRIKVREILLHPYFEEFYDKLPSIIFLSKKEIIAKHKAPKGSIFCADRSKMLWKIIEIGNLKSLYLDTIALAMTLFDSYTTRYKISNSELLGRTISIVNLAARQINNVTFSNEVLVSLSGDDLYSEEDFIRFNREILESFHYNLNRSTFYHEFLLNTNRKYNMFWTFESYKTPKSHRIAFISYIKGK